PKEFKKVRQFPSEQLAAVISWQGEFFINGHTIEYLDAMDYWTFLEITDGINVSRS
ncbi:unnamed protein product, partial [marine sediment metagenome]